MKIKWDGALCNSYGTCTEEAPEVFSLNPEGRLEIATMEPPPELHEKVRNACDMCPTRALEIEE